MTLGLALHGCMARPDVPCCLHCPERRRLNRPLHSRRVQGTHAGMPVKLFIHVKDERGLRMKEGGEDVAVRVQATGVGASQQYIGVAITDNNDGTYTAVYTPPAKGNYLVSVEINGMAIAGSPFPVFFSQPLDPAQLAALQEAEARQAAAAQAAALPPPPPPGSAEAIVAAATANVAAQQAANDEPLRTLYVANISPAVPIEKLRELFSIFGTVSDMTLLGDKKDMAVVTFTAKEAQGQAQQLNNTMFGDRPLSVTAPIAAMAAGITPANPQLAMQVQQIQQMQVRLAWVAFGG